MSYILINLRKIYNKLHCVYCLILNNVSIGRSRNFITFVVILYLSIFFAPVTTIKSQTILDDFYWEEALISPEVYKNTYWYEIFFLKDNPKYGFVCGDDGAFAKTNNGGKSWNATQITPNFHAESVFFADTLIGYVSGDLGIFKTNDGGKSWKHLKTPLPKHIGTWGHYITDANHIWFVGGNCSTGEQCFLRSFDGGGSWLVTTIIHHESHLTDITMSETGKSGYAIGSGVIWQTIDSGKNWKIFAKTPEFSYNNAFGIPTTSRFNWHEDLQIYNNSFVIPVSMECAGSFYNQGGLAFSKNNGISWKIFYTKASMFGTWIINDSVAWGAGQSNEIYYTKNSGENWNYFNCGIQPNKHLDDLFFINDTTGFVVGEGIYYLTHKKTNLGIYSPKLKLCINETTVLYPDTEYKTYEWYCILDSGDTILVDINDSCLVSYPAGKYFAVAYDSDCYSVTSNILEIEFFPKTDVELTQNKSSYCLGDTAIITFTNKKNIASWVWNTGSFEDTIRVTESGEYKLIYTDNISNCEYSLSINLDFEDFAAPLLTLNGPATFCDGDSVEISLENFIFFTNIVWYNDSVEIAKNISKIQVSTSGNYYVYASNSNNCAAYSDTISISILNLKNSLTFNFDEIPFDFDSINYSKIICKDLLVYNTSETQINISNIFFLKKIAFSIPMSQLPITIPAGGYEKIKICYSPTDIVTERDTLVFEDICSNHFIPLVGHGAINKDTTVSRCELPITTITKEILYKNKLIINQPIPNPAQNFTKINYFYYCENDEETNFIDLDITCNIYNILGQEVFLPIKNIIFKESNSNNNFYNNNHHNHNFNFNHDFNFDYNSNYNIIFGELRLQLENLLPGSYLIKITYKKQIYTYCLLVI